MPDMVDEVRLAPFVPERDVDLVAGWLRVPGVSRWWGEPEQALREVLQRPNGGGDALIYADEVPVGYIRWQVPTRKELDAAGLSEIPNDAMDIDIAIGEPDYIGRGIGPRAIRLVLEQIRAGGDRMVMIATSVDNAASIRAFEKAGFSRRRQFDDPGYGRCWLMVLDAPAV